MKKNLSSDNAKINDSIRVNNFPRRIGRCHPTRHRRYYRLLERTILSKVAWNRRWGSAATTISTSRITSASKTSGLWFPLDIWSERDKWCLWSDLEVLRSRPAVEQRGLYRRSFSEYWRRWRRTRIIQGHILWKRPNRGRRLGELLFHDLCGIGVTSIFLLM